MSLPALADSIWCRGLVQAHTPDRAHGAHRLSPARSVNLGAPPSRPVREHQRDCHCQRLGRLTPSELYKINLPSYIEYEYNQSSTEQSYKYRMTYHLYRMSVLYLHARHSAVPYVHYGMNSGEVISVRPHWSPRPIQADQTSLTGGCRE